MQQQSMCQLSASARIRVRVKARVRVRVRVRIRLALKLLDHSLSLLLLQAEHQNPCSKAFSLWYLNFQAQQQKGSGLCPPGETGSKLTN